MNKTLLAILLLGLFCISSVNAVVGVDLADPTDEGTFQCLKDNYGIQFTITRGYKSIGAVDYNAIGTNINAKNLGLITDVYLFPCMDVDPSDTASAFVNNMVDGNGNDVYGTVWIDVEHNPSSRCAWSSDTNRNCGYLSNLVSVLQGYGKLVGIYSSKYQWENIFGDFDNCANFTSLPIWYAHYDGKASFSDWYNGYSFGGWNEPAIKQYAGDQTACGSDVDFNYY